MSTLNSQYADYSIHRSFVDSLKQDGAICDSYAKEYDEEATLEGGSGDRLAFKKVNDKIIEYQEILKYLTGERRANIRETIPVIDFAHTENTSFMNTYNYKNDGTIDPTSIRVIDSVGDGLEDESALDYILNEDESLINRALSGSSLAEHFYNTASQNVTEYDIQTSPYQGDYAFIYEGILSPPVTNSYTGEKIRGLRKDTIMVSKISTDTAWVGFDPISGFFKERIEVDEDPIRDEYGTIIPSMGLLGPNNSEFITEGGNYIVEIPIDDGSVEVEGNTGYDYTLELSTGDIIVILPSSASTADMCRILIFKLNPNQESNTITENISSSSYEPYILYVNTYSAAIGLSNIEAEESLGNYLDNITILNTLSNYIQYRKEYYSKASGLLNGYFSEPVERDNSGEVTKWRFVTDMDKASELGVGIDVGAKYYEGHILGRGFNLDEPFRTTSPDEVGYNGKATYIYDKMKESANKLLSAVTVDNWSLGWNLRKVDSVITKADYANKKLSKTQYADWLGVSVNETSTPPLNVRYPEKFQNNNQPLTYDDFRSYFDACMDHLEDNGNGTYTFVSDLNTDPNTGWIRENYQGGSDGKHHKGSSPSDANPDIIYHNFEKIFFLGWNRVEEDKKAPKEAEHVRLRMVSPIDAFCSSGNDDTILIYPEYNKYLPPEMYLISKYDLGLEVYRDSESEGNRGMVSFYNADAKKVICFKISAINKFFPSKITRVKFYEPLISKTIEKNIRAESVEAGSDCYIYYLAPMELSMSGITIYDWNNQPMDLSKGINDFRVMPMSYPNDYFKVTIEESESGPRYIVDLAHRTTDIEYLQNSYLLPGLPSYDKATDFYKIKKDNLTLDLFALMLDENNDDGIGPLLKSTISSGISYILSQWPLSDSETNPIRFKDFEGVLKGYINIKPLLNDLVASNFNIPRVTENGDDLIIDYNQPISAEDLNGLNNRIEYDDESSYAHISFSVDEDNEAWTIEEGESFAEIVYERLNLSSMTSDSDKISLRPSLKKLLGLMQTLYTSTEEYGREYYQQIDNYLGNGTPAFIRLGGYNNENITPNYINTVINKYRQSMLQLIVKTDQEWKFNLMINDLIDLYQQYYTSESIARALNCRYENGEIIVDENAEAKDFASIIDQLEINYRATQVSNLLQTIKYRGYSTGTKASRNYYKGWRSKPFNEWKEEFGLDPVRELAYTEENYAGSNAIKNEVKEYCESSILSALDNKFENYKLLSAESINNYINEKPERLSVETIQNADSYQLRARFIIPDQVGADYTLTESDKIFEFNSPSYKMTSFDVGMNVLEGIVSYITTNLEGTGDASYYVRHIKGDDGILGRENSLYYKRYQMLNNRLNKANGKLAAAARFMNSQPVIQSLNSYGENLEESYRKFLTLTPISKITKLSYFPKQKSSGTTIPMEGKFYYEEELEALRAEINDKCVLTCNYCEVKDSCPFYNEDEILKLYCDEAQTLDIYLKDNELDLIYYDDNSPHLIHESIDGKDSEIFDPNILKDIHEPFADIETKMSISGGNIKKYNIRRLEDIRNDLESKIENFEKESRGGLGRLINGRYGTVQINDLAFINENDSTMSNSELDISDLPKYKLLYDALYFKDTESEFIYKPSTNAYNVELISGPFNDKKVYKGTTRIKIPVGIRLLSEANPNDDLYLVSDDLKDSAGRSIVPVIYINKVSDVEYTFDLTETEINKGVTSSNDFNLYAADVAQWSINIAKGTCSDDPIGSHNDKNLDKDQYWMQEIKKPVILEDGTQGYLNLKGRERIATNYQEACVSTDNYDSSFAVSGRPVVNSYINFIRPFKIAMRSIKWVKPNSNIYSNLDYENKVETQKSVLPLMKTNLRLVIVKNNSVY